MSNYTIEDTNPILWPEFDLLIDNLITDINQYFTKHNKKIHVISQLHRTGGIVGSILAIKMELVPLLPVQFKYTYNPTDITQISSVPDLLVDVPEDMNVILAEGNTSSGSVAKLAAKAIKEKYPKSTIYLATLTRVYGGFDSLENIEHIFQGAFTNEKFLATSQEIAQYSIREGITVFPWENLEQELVENNLISDDD